MCPTLILILLITTEDTFDQFCLFSSGSLLINRDSLFMMAIKPVSTIFSPCLLWPPSPQPSNQYPVNSPSSRPPVSHPHFLHPCPHILRGSGLPEPLPSGLGCAHSLSLVSHLHKPPEPAPALTSPPRYKDRGGDSRSPWRGLLRISCPSIVLSFFHQHPCPSYPFL